MKIKLSELKPNPFKKEINGGKLNEEQIEKLMSNMKELGMINSIPVRKKDGIFEMCFGHHRVEAMKRKFGKDYEIEITVQDYDDAKMLKSMVIENLSQKSEDFRETLQCLISIRNFRIAECSSDEQSVKPRNEKGQLQGGVIEAGSVRDIADWLDKTGKIISLGKICEYFDIEKKLNPKVLDMVANRYGKNTSKNNLQISEAKILMDIPKDEQEALAKQLIENNDDNRETKKEWIKSYNNAPEEIKQKVLDGEIGLQDVQDEILNEDFRKRKEEGIPEYEPSFLERLKTFEGSILDAEVTISVFRKFFDKKNFVKFYGMLSDEQRQTLKSFVYSINDRTKALYEEIEGYCLVLEMNKIEGEE